MADYSYSSEVFLNELLRISSGIVWKNPKKALDNENPSNIIQVEQYMLARQGKLIFDLIYKFDEEALVKAGLPESTIQNYADDPSSIPVSMRDICVKCQTDYILNNYDEQNNYYRMLNGLPDLDDTEFVYNTKYPDISNDITPLHLLDSSQLIQLEANGYLNEMMELYPDKKYLNHLTEKKIDIYNARTALDYSILWMQQSDYENLTNEFKEMYNACRYMTISIYNLKTLSNENTEYCGFIGLNILFATIIQMHRKFLDTDITRDFYDENSLQYVYDSYGVPFYSAIPIEYHKNIVKNINRLISYKGSTRVLFELFDIFGMSGISIYEFYMLKMHKFEDGKPVFVKDADGNYDLQKMYDVKFAKVQLYNDPSSEISNQQNHVDYEDLVSSDPYWISDEDLINKIYQEDYNYVDSKYLGIQTTFNLMQIMYESSYYMKMIIDNRQLLEGSTVYNNSIKKKCDIFDLIIYACALICKSYGYDGNIPSDPHEIGKVLGFNFKLDLVTLKENISKNDYLKNDKELLTYLETMNVNSLASVYTVYTKLTELRSYLADKMAETDDHQVYWAYYELYNTIMYSEYVDNVFKKSDGEPAESFSDLLQDINVDLYDRLNSDSVDIEDEISDVLYLIKSSCKALSNIQYLDDINIDVIMEYLFKLMEFFKSAKADLTGYELVYSLASRVDNIYKLMTYIHYSKDELKLPTDYFDELTDLIFMIREYERLEENFIRFIDEMHWTDTTKVQSIIDYFDDYLKTIHSVVYDITEEMELEDIISKHADVFMLPEDPMNFHDTVTCLYDDIQEVLRYVLEFDPMLFDTIITMTNSLNILPEDKLLFASALTSSIFSKIGSSSYYMSDNISAYTLDKHKFEYALADALLSVDDITLILRSSLESGESLWAKIKYFSNKEYVSEVSFEDYLSDSDKVLLNELMYDNKFELFSRIMSSLCFSLVETSLELNSSIKQLKDISSHIMCGEVSYLDTGFTRMSSSHMRNSVHTMTDTLTNVFTRVIEE